MSIGTGGWDYFPLQVKDRLEAYSKLFNFVEVNSTFYNDPPLRMVAEWRKKVPANFEFSVKCSKKVTHDHRFQHNWQLLEEMKYMVEICKQLNAKVIILETPPHFNISNSSIGDIAKTVSYFQNHDLMVAWEHRGSLNPQAVLLMKDMGVVHSTDLARDSPSYDHQIIYSRLFGKGDHTLYKFTEHDFDEIKDKVRSSGAKKAYLAFHGVAMYLDAFKFKKAWKG